MRQLAPLTLASIVVLPVFAVSVSAQGHDLAVDFRMTESGTSGGRPVDGAGKGHALVTKDRMRFEMTGNTRMMSLPGSNSGGDVTMIMLDGGKTFIILQPKTKQYMRIRPGEMMDGMQKMMDGMGANMKIDFTGDEPKVEKLGAGPDILGHHTTHYRVTGHTKVSMAIMGQNQQIESSTVTDEYVTPELTGMIDPFRGFGSNAGGAMMGGMMGAGMKDYMEKMQAARAKVPGFRLRTETHLTTSGSRQTSEMKTVNEVTRVQNTTASPGDFEVPPGYTPITMPTMPPMRGPDATPSAKH